MAYNSRAYRILIASPGDVEVERELAVRVMQEWNDVHSYSRKVVLLPLRWETHTAPDYATRPQEVINRAIVDDCDLLIGIFWTRIGTPTGEADSGTLEEIAKVATAGRPVMLYFSKVGANPDDLNLEQLERLRVFERETRQHALTESYKSHIDFRDKFSQQLQMKVGELQKDDNPHPAASIFLKLASSVSPSERGKSVNANVEILKVDDISLLDNLPTDAKSRVQSEIAMRRQRLSSIPVWLLISNIGSSGIRNLYVEVQITAETEIDVVDEANFTRLSTSLSLFSNSIAVNNSEYSSLSRNARGWKFAFEWDALQPQRERWASSPLFIYSETDVTVAFDAKIFADSFPLPVEIAASMTILTHIKRVQLEDVVANWKAIAEGNNGITFYSHSPIVTPTNINIG